MKSKDVKIVETEPKPLRRNKQKVLDDLKEAVDELNLVLSGKAEVRDADELFNEL